MTAMQRALADVEKLTLRHLGKAVRRIMEPPPPGFVKVHLSLVINEKLFDDEPALGAFLVSAAKRSRRDA